MAWLKAEQITFTFQSTQNETYEIRSLEDDAFKVYFMRKKNNPEQLKLLTANVHDFIRLQTILLKELLSAKSLSRSTSEKVYSELEPDFNYNLTLSNPSDIQKAEQIFSVIISVAQMKKQILPQKFPALSQNIPEQGVDHNDSQANSSLPVNLQKNNPVNQCMPVSPMASTVGEEANERKNGSYGIANPSKPTVRSRFSFLLPKVRPSNVQATILNMAEESFEL